VRKSSICIWSYSITKIYRAFRFRLSKLHFGTSLWCLFFWNVNRLAMYVTLVCFFVWFVFHVFVCGCFFIIII
jgi:hypothetical protein